MNKYNTEVLCHMLERLSKHVVERSRETRRLETEMQKEPQQDKKDKAAAQKKYVVKGSNDQSLTA